MWEFIVLNKKNIKSFDSFEKERFDYRRIATRTLIVIFKERSVFVGLKFERIRKTYVSWYDLLQLNSLKILKKKNSFSLLITVLPRNFVARFYAGIWRIRDLRAFLVTRAQPSWFRTSDEFILRWNKCNTAFEFSIAKNKRFEDQ